MFQKLKELTPFDGVISTAATASSPSCSLPIGPRYHELCIQILFKRGATAAASIATVASNLRLKINGRVQRNLTLTELNAYHTMLGTEYGYTVSGADNTTQATALDGQLGTTWGDTSSDYTCLRMPIYFAEPWRKTYGAQEGLALPTVWPNGKQLASLQVEVDLTPTTAVEILSVKMFGSFDSELGKLDANGNPVLNLVKFYSNGYVYAAGDNTYTNFPKGPAAGWLQHMTLQPTTTDLVTNLQIVCDGDIKHDASRRLNQKFLKSQGFNMSSQNFTTPGSGAGGYDFHADRNDNPTSALDLTAVKDYQVVATLADSSLGTTMAGTALRVVSSYFGPAD